MSIARSRNRLVSRITFAWHKRRMQRRFRRSMGYHGDFDNPRTYEEKIQFRNLYGNHPLYAQLADKYRVREFVADRVGGKYLVPLLGVYDRLRSDHLKTLPQSFVIKTNHASGWNRIVRNKDELNVRKTVKYFNRRVRMKYGVRSGELHYSLIPPKILIEQLLLSERELPCDYRFYCYHGARGFDYAIGISSPCRTVRADYDRDWNRWESSLSARQERLWSRPKNFDEMVHVARKLSTDFDFIRVDLFNLSGRIFFGELTCTPGAGTTPIENELRSAKRTEMWDIDALNERLYRRRRAA